MSYGNALLFLWGVCMINAQENSKIEDFIAMFILISLVAISIIYAINLEISNKKGLEIINHPSFVGEVITKIDERFYRRGVWMRIQGEYISDYNEIIHFDRRLKVSAEMFNLYEVGDIISVPDE